MEVRHLWIDCDSINEHSREVKSRGEIIKSRQLSLTAGNLQTLRSLRSERDMLVLGFECDAPGCFQEVPEDKLKIDNRGAQ